MRHPHHDALNIFHRHQLFLLRSVSMCLTSTPRSVLASMTCFMHGISISTPSSPNLFSPGHFFARKFSNPMDLYCFVRKKYFLFCKKYLWTSWSSPAAASSRHCPAAAILASLVFAWIKDEKHQMNRLRWFTYYLIHWIWSRLLMWRYSAPILLRRQQFLVKQTSKAEYRIQRCAQHW